MDIKNVNSVFTKEMLKTDECFSVHSTFGIGGKIAYYYEPTSIRRLVECINFANDNNLEYKIIGNGSNILCSDNGFNGLIICTKKLSKIYYNSDMENVRAFTGAKLPNLVKFCSKNSLGGLEAFCGIPATIGGAVTMNAGAFGYNISSFIKSVCCLYKNRKIILHPKDCNFVYRNSIFRNNKYVILYVDLFLERCDSKIIEEKMKNYAIVRNETQPKGKSCGSVFKNPFGYTAGRVIESVALKGYKVGDAMVSTKHANFIINNGNAKSQDVVKLIKIIKHKVKKIFKIDLNEEIEYLGF